jgi:hypothetical protein
MQHKRQRTCLATAPQSQKLHEWESLGWLGNLDSNQDKQSQSLLCYRYTIPQRITQQVQWFKELPAIAPEPQIAAQRLPSFYSFAAALGKGVTDRQDCAAS